MQDLPHADDLIDAVIRFLGDRAAPQLDASAAFDARVAASLLRIVQREAALGGPAAAAERAGLASLLGGPPGDLFAMNQELCARIADGRIDAARADLIDHLWLVTLAKVAIDQPSHSTYVLVRSGLATDTNEEST